MKFKRLKGGKGEKWKKGQSCVSNPSKFTHRNKAKENFFHKKDGPSDLTVNALAQHAAALTVGANDFVLTADPADDQSIGRTFNTFATNYTTNTCQVFDKFFQNFDEKSDMQTSMLAVYRGAQEILQEEAIPETNVSYLCAFMESLEGVKDDENLVAATLSLLARVIRKVDTAIIQAKFSKLEKLLSDLFQKYSRVSNINSAIVINTLGCLSVVLRTQTLSYWEKPFAQNLLKEMLEFITHDNSKIRKAAQYNISVILKTTSFTGNSGDEEDENKEVFLINHPATKVIEEFIIHNSKISANMNGTATLYLLLFFQQIITVLPTKRLEKCCSHLLAIMQIADSTIKCRGLKVLISLFTSKTPSGLTLELNTALINVLIQGRENESSKTLNIIPKMNDESLTNIWIATVTSGIIQLNYFSPSKAVQYLDIWSKLLVTFWKSEHKSVHISIFHAFEELLDTILQPYFEHFENGPPENHEIALVAFSNVQKALSFQFEMAAPNVYRTMTAFYKVIGCYFPMEMSRSLEELSKRVSIPNCENRNCLERTIEAAISAIGPANVLKVVPVQITGTIAEDEKYVWILPLLKKHVKNSRLSFFETNLLPLARKCDFIIERMKLRPPSENISLLIKTYSIIEKQIWSLLSNFADGAPDIDEIIVKKSGNGKRFGEEMGHYIQNREDLRMEMLTALRTMINTVKGTENKKLCVLSKNFLPILFNLYLTPPKDKATSFSKETTILAGHRMAVLVTIETYLEIISPARLVYYVDNAMTHYEGAEKGSFKQIALLNIIKCFIPHLELGKLVEIWDKVKIVLKDKKSKIQKIVYRMMESMLNLEALDANSWKLLKDLWVESTKTISVTAKAARLKCIIVILQQAPESINDNERNVLFKSSIEEAIKYCNSQHSIATRKNAYSLLHEIGITVQRIMRLSLKDTFSYCFDYFPKVDSTSPLVPNIILALTALFYRHYESIQTEILEKIITEVTKLLTSSESDVVKSCLGFIRIVYVLFKPLPIFLCQQVEKIIQSFLLMSEAMRKKFRMKIRDILSFFIRKFGGGYIKKFVPESDKMLKMVQNLIKAENRKKRNKTTESVEDDEDNKEVIISTVDQILHELEDDIEDNEKKVTKKKSILKRKAKETYIMEDEDNIVDLLDVESSQNIKHKNPAKSIRFQEKDVDEEEKYGFKIDKKTNKFIITENEREPRPTNEDDDMMAFGELNEIMDKKTEPENNNTKKRKRRLSGDSDLEEALVKQKAKIKKNSNKNKFDYAAPFRLSKAGGDNLRKGGLAPYAYVPFSKEKLNKRKKAKYAGQFKTLLQGSKKGRKKTKVLSNELTKQANM